MPEEVTVEQFLAWTQHQKSIISVFNCKNGDTVNKNTITFKKNQGRESNCNSCHNCKDHFPMWLNKNSSFFKNSKETHNFLVTESEIRKFNKHIQWKSNMNLSPNMKKVSLCMLGKVRICKFIQEVFFRHWQYTRDCIVITVTVRET